MEIANVLSRFEIIAKLDAEDAEHWKPVCESAIIDLELKVRKDITLETSDVNRLEVTAAALAFYRYALYTAASAGFEVFSGGEIQGRLDLRTSVSNAYTVWREARNSISDLLVDSDFAFDKI